MNAETNLGTRRMYPPVGWPPPPRVPSASTLPPVDVVAEVDTTLAELIGDAVTGCRAADRAVDDYLGVLPGGDVWTSVISAGDRRAVRSLVASRWADAYAAAVLAARAAQTSMTAVMSYVAEHHDSLRAAVLGAYNAAYDRATDTMVTAALEADPVARKVAEDTAADGAKFSPLSEWIAAPNYPCPPVRPGWHRRDYAYASNLARGVIEGASSFIGIEHAAAPGTSVVSDGYHATVTPKPLTVADYPVLAKLDPIADRFGQPRLPRTAPTAVTASSPRTKKPAAPIT